VKGTTTALESKKKYECSDAAVAVVCLLSVVVEVVIVLCGCWLLSCMLMVVAVVVYSFMLNNAYAKPFRSIKSNNTQNNKTKLIRNYYWSKRC
jgi:ABC-type Fe3+ transport system permease subunit